MAIIGFSLVVNVLVAGFFGVTLAFGLSRVVPNADAVFGPDSPSRRILACHNNRRAGTRFEIPTNVGWLKMARLMCKVRERIQPLS